MTGKQENEKPQTSTFASRRAEREAREAPEGAPQRRRNTLRAGIDAPSQTFTITHVDG
jgi:hypothetical protein